MRFLIALILFGFLNSCAETGKTNTQHDLNSYLIKKIRKQNDWFIIFANKHDSTFMIVSKRPETVNQNLGKIKIGEYYNLKLTSIIPVIHGVKLIPINYLDFSGINLDKKTVVNINPEKGIYDIYSADNLTGLFLLK
jgi:hypothetical protein